MQGFFPAESAAMWYSVRTAMFRCRITETERWSVITADMKNQGHLSARSAAPDISENFGQEHSRSKTL